MHGLLPPQAAAHESTAEGGRGVSSTAKRQRQKDARRARLEEARIAEGRRKRRRQGLYLGLVGVAVVLVLFIVSRGGDDDEPDAATATTSETGDPAEFTYGSGPCPAEDGSSPPTLDFTDAPELCIDPAAQYTAVFATNRGEIRVALDTDTTPGTVNNFVTLARYHYFDGTDIFRTDPSIGIIQGGSPHTQDNSDPGPGYNLPDEGFDFNSLVDPSTGQPSGGPYNYLAGDLVMARSSQPNGGSAQFFFCVTADCANLDSQGVYVTFGQVSEGLDVLQAILALHADNGSGLGGAPSEPVVIESVTIEEA